jgi:hypothetical protein
MGKLGGLSAMLVALVAACEDPGPTGPGVRFSLPSTGLPAPLEVPWPSDLYKSDADGTIADGLSWSALKIDTAAAAFEAYGGLDGFGRQAGALFFVDGLGMKDAVDAATITCGTSVLLLALDGGGPVPCYAGLDPFVGTITVAPRDALASGQRYAAVVTTGVKLRDGRALVAPRAFANIRDGSARSSTAERLYGKGVDDALAADQTLTRDRIAGLTVFTTQTAHTQLKKIRDALEAGKLGAAPALMTTGIAAPYVLARFGATAHAGWTAALDEWLAPTLKAADGSDLPGIPTPGDLPTTGVAHDAIGAVLNAAFVSPELRRPFTGTASRDDGTIAFDENGDPIAVKIDQQVPVTIVLPRTAVPPNGFPVVIFQHGLGGDRSGVFGVANDLARAGIATLGIDAPLHGMRASDATDTANNGRGSFAGPDGLADGEFVNPLRGLQVATELLSRLKNFTAVRDNFWQAAIDVVQLRRLIANCDLSLLADEYGGSAPKLDATRVGFIGNSMGGILGTLLAGIEPKSAIDPFVLDVPGAGLVRAVTESPLFATQAAVLTGLAGIPVEALDGGLASAWAQLAQGLFDGADAGSFAADAAAAHNIWMTGALQDETMTRFLNDSLARSLGATQVTPTLRPIDGLPQAPSPLLPGGSGLVVGYYEVAPGTHPHLMARITPMYYEPPVPRDEEPRFPKLPQRLLIRQAIIGSQRAIVDFLQATWAGAPKIVVDAALYPGLLPVADADDDGYCDEDERAAGSDPFDRASTPQSGAANCVRNVGFDFP